MGTRESPESRLENKPEADLKSGMDAAVETPAPKEAQLVAHLQEEKDSE